jgi:hypothetical protein
MGRIQQHRAGHLVLEPAGVVARVRAAEGVAHEDIGRGNLGHREQPSEFVGHLRGGSGQRLPVAPASPRPVVDHAHRSPRDLLLDVEVVEPDCPGPGQEDHRRAPAPGAVQEQSAPLHPVERPQRRSWDVCAVVVVVVHRRVPLFAIGPLDPLAGHGPPAQSAMLSQLCERYQI